MKKLLCTSIAAAALAACGGGGIGASREQPAAAKPNANANLNFRPAFLSGSVRWTEYDGVNDDLLTAGLGAAGLASAASPGYANALAPTAAELRRNAIWNNYRALVDMTANGGYGTLYGPNVDASGAVTAGEGRIPGDEYIVYADDGTGRQNVTLMVQIPSTFSPASPCIVSAASSGSRGVYGAIATAGEWGLKKGCAVAYTDKGSGNGGHDLAANAVNVLLGPRFDAGAAGLFSQFTANLSASELAAYNSAFPNRWAYKHAHSQQNPERDWGRDTLRAIEFAFYMINEKHGAVIDGVRQKTVTPANTIVIASSVSNGGGAAIAAAEQDTAGLIDGIAVGEPQINLNAPANVTIKRGNATLAASAIARPLYDYFTLANLYQPCAAYAPSNAASPLLVLVNASAAGNRCAALAAQGLVTGNSTAEQAADALNRLHQFGWEAEQGVAQLSPGTIVIGPMVASNFYDSHLRPGQEPPPPPELYDQKLTFVFIKWDQNGNEIRKTLTYRVVGVLASNSGESDWSIIMRLEDVKRLNEWTSGQRINYNKDGYSLVIVKVDDADHVLEVNDTISAMGYQTYTMQSFVEGINNFYLVLQVVFGGVGAIALLVAAIGIANTMAMAILERTREIGLMKAIGATNRDVLSIFLGEAGGIGFLGGLGGVLIGWLASYGINLIAVVFLANQAAQQGGAAPSVAVYTPLWLPLFALFFSTLVGMASGLYPALRAATMIPVLALKYE